MVAKHLIERTIHSLGSLKGINLMFMDSEDLLAGLNHPQKQAVLHGEGPLLILAGAGSGKTRVITRRIVQLMQNGVRAQSILAITFTNKAAGEMRKRVDSIVPGHRVQISTFHSFGVRLLRQYADRLGLNKDFTIYDQSDRSKLTKIAIEDSGLNAERFTPDTISNSISKAKNQLLSPEKYAQSAKDFFSQSVAQVYPYYEKRLRESNALDFDDLLYWPALALRNDPELRAELDARYRYVMVDEYQDTNTAQYAIARGLSVDYPNLCVVGDPDQSIYKFRGSDIRNILDFERDFPNATVLTLSENYRSTKPILSAADRLISHNTQRKPKPLISMKEGGSPVTQITFDTGAEEANGVAKRIAQQVNSGNRTFRDFAVFVRMNALTRSLESAFSRHRVPFQIVKGMAFFDRKEIRDVLSYLRLLVNSHDNISFMRAVNEPARGIGKVSLDHLKNHAEPREISLLEACGVVEKIPTIKGKAASGLRDFSLLMKGLRELLEHPPHEVIAKTLDASGYREMLRRSTDTEDQERLANIEELVSAARQFQVEDREPNLADFLENISLASDTDAHDANKDSVSVMTLHAAKGLEFPVVYMLAMEQGILPHDRSLENDEELQEERRLAFVGMTRAMHELFLCNARMRDFRGSVVFTAPSMFLGQLPESEIKVIEEGPSTPMNAMLKGPGKGSQMTQGWKNNQIKAPTVAPINPMAVKDGNYAEGLIVKHPAYGKGMITEISGYGAMRRLKIRFQTAGERSFIADKVQLEIVRS